MVLHDAIGMPLDEKGIAWCEMGGTMVPGQITEVHGGIDLAGGQQSAPYVVVLIQRIYKAVSPDGLVLGVARAYEQPGPKS